MEEGADDCYTPTYLMGSVKSSQYDDIANFFAETINDQCLPIGLNYTTLFHIICVQMYVKLGFEYRIQVGLAQTNCSTPPEYHISTYVA